MERTIAIPNDAPTFSITATLCKINPIFKASLKVLVAGFVLANLTCAIIEHNHQQIIPVKLAPRVLTVVSPPAPPVLHSAEFIAIQRTTAALTLLGCEPEKIGAYAKSCYLGGTVASIDPVFIACLMKTESDFKITAKSHMHYKSVMQTPTATGFVEADTVHGAVILRNHMADTHGNLEAALTRYKGSRKMVLASGKKSVGYKQALDVLELYAKTKRNINK